MTAKATPVPAAFAHRTPQAFCFLPRQAPFPLSFGTASALPSALPPRRPAAFGPEPCQPPSFWFPAQKALSRPGFWPASPLPFGFHPRKTPSFCVSHQQATFPYTCGPGIHLPSAVRTSQLPFLLGFLGRESLPDPFLPQKPRSTFVSAHDVFSPEYHFLPKISRCSHKMATSSQK